MDRCEICQNRFKKASIKRGSPTKMCRLCIRLRFAELRFHPYILIKKVIKRRDIFSLSTVELLELNLSGVFKKYPALRYHPILNRLANHLVYLF